ncbi:hypothetical protein B5P44_00960 [Mycobacterium sp. CBMA 213]|uniref:Uncharacterized protein n=1 Tax=Mycolicibacterium sp. CBMA 213 TaxID=1968788 RepID=A0A343VRI2_9MYCO|nr:MULTISPECIES: hypothetical protein [unclassified Mycolicibacterium]AVN58506.1 hypothetical protein B5P44_p00211 [Mycolicibacterium sp. CBMA 213]MUL61152.1 hypothetical protein [Mycolicibacterium sp. CBMA 335]MUM03390.1 hypothetical protein [Mycolicibacterium sp. CBMA 213]
MSTPNARKAAARRYQREHPGTPYPEALRAVSAGVVLHLPALDGSAVSEGLRGITRAVHARVATEVPESLVQTPGFAGLGGDDGYGEDWSNATFTMRPFCYGDCTCGQDERIERWEADNRHAPGCAQIEIKQLRDRYTGRKFWEHFERLKTRLEIPDEGAMWHCTCGREAAYQQLTQQHAPDCAPFMPNFVYHPTGAEIRWYKWIGRDMEITGDLPTDFGEQCVRSLG